MMNTNQIEEKVVAFIREELGKDIKGHDQDLMKEAIIDSFNMIQLIQYVEETFELSIDLDELDLNAFKSVKSIAEQVTVWKSL